ncbi:MAG TPA: ATP-binding protein [Chitinophagaceae bacterium]
MRSCMVMILFLSALLEINAQDKEMSGIKYRLATTRNDTLKMILLDSLAFDYSESNPDSSYYYSEAGRVICHQLGYKLHEAYALNGKGYALMNMGNYPMALQTLLNGLEIASDPENEKNIPPDRYRILVLPGDSSADHHLFRLQILTWIHVNLGVLYENTGNVQKQLYHYRQALRLTQQTNDQSAIGTVNMNLGRIYLAMKKPDSALLFEQKAYEIVRQSNLPDYSGSVLLNLGRIYLAMGKEGTAINYIQQAITTSKEQNYVRGVIAGNLLLSEINVQRNKIDSGFYFAQMALSLAIQMNSPDLLLRSYNAMAGLYSSVNNNDSIVKYQGLIIRIKDSLFNSKQAQQFQNIDFNETLRQQELESARKEYNNRLQKYILIGGIAIFLFAAIILWRNNINKQKAYRLLKIQKDETDQQKTIAEKALEELKTTQAQLIQSEKMASLGELTAGIAHEIQNPLNFVNNFSDVNKELIAELRIKNEKLKIEDNEAKELLNDIEQNLEKINHHGKRAEAIVKGMLQHSRSSSGQKEPTDINALADEYLRLAYHGLRAKDKSFNATTKTYFDNSIGKLNVVPQEIGRVILNLINNAFYAVNEKAKQNIPGYDPTVIVTTKKDKDKIEIKVKDNGSGIPQKILDKIFQPFFTTKPSGQGTGLGLSLGYDIVTKGHAGELKVETKEGEGSQFSIVLPID